MVARADWKEEGNWETMMGNSTNCCHTYTAHTQSMKYDMAQKRPFRITPFQPPGGGGITLTFTIKSSTSTVDNL